MSYFTRLFVAGLSLAGAVGSAPAQQPPPFDWSQFNQEIFEFVGQVKNFPPAGPGLLPTSIQYGYLSHVKLMRWQKTKGIGY